MLIIYRGWGLAWAAAGMVLFPVLFLLTGSLSCPLIAISALWIRYGRAKKHKDSDETIPSPSVFFIPVWFYGAVLAPIAMVLVGVETMKGRVVDWEADADPIELHEIAEDGDPLPVATSNISTAKDSTAAGETPTPAGNREEPEESRVLALPQVASHNTATKGPASTALKPESVSPVVSVKDDAPGNPVSADTELRPGQKLAAAWAGKWYQVAVVADEGGTLRVDWLGSNSWNSSRARRDSLRLVSEEEFQKCLRYGSEEPITPGPALAVDTTLKLGDVLLCEASGSWLPVRVLQEADGQVQIGWQGFAEKWNQTVSRDQLRLRPEKSQPASPTSTTGNRSDEDAPGIPVTDDVDLAPGQKLARNWARKWYKVVVVGVEGTRVKVDYLRSNSWRATSLSRDSLRVVSDEEFEKCLFYGNDEPEDPGDAIAADTELPVGTILYCDRSGGWIPVRVTGEADNGDVQVDWLSFKPNWNQAVSRDHLRTVAKGSRSSHSLRAFLMKYSATSQEPGAVVTDELDLKAGTIVLHSRGSRWLPMEVVGSDGEDVSVRDWVRPDEVVTVKRSDLRLSTSDL